MSEHSTWISLYAEAVLFRPAPDLRNPLDPRYKFVFFRSLASNALFNAVKSRLRPKNAQLPLRNTPNSIVVTTTICEGHTVYVYGYGVTEDILRSQFTPYGPIVNISMEVEKNCGFITYEKVMEKTDYEEQCCGSGFVFWVWIRIHTGENRIS